MQPPPRLLFRRPLSTTTFSSIAHSCQLSTTRSLCRSPLRAVRRSLHNSSSGLRNPNNANNTPASRFRPTSFPSRPLKKHFFSFPRRFNSTESASSKTSSFSQRMKKLSREYGWSALGIYLALSALDFPFCFAAVRLLGVERIGHYEHVIVEGAKGIFEPLWPRSKEDEEQEQEQDNEQQQQQREEPGSGDLDMAGDGEDTHYDHGVMEAQKRNAEEGASIWTQLALAYAIHKSFIFIRVPLTAAITPKVVHVLRRWGWDIGKRKPKGG